MNSDFENPPSSLVAGPNGTKGSLAPLAAIKQACTKIERFNTPLKSMDHVEIAMVSLRPDFLGSGPGMVRVRSLILGAIKDATSLRWVMQTTQRSVSNAAVLRVPVEIQGNPPLIAFNPRLLADALEIGSTLYLFISCSREAIGAEEVQVEAGRFGVEESRGDGGGDRGEAQAHHGMAGGD